MESDRMHLAETICLCFEACYTCTVFGILAIGIRRILHQQSPIIRPLPKARVRTVPSAFDFSRRIRPEPMATEL